MEKLPFLEYLDPETYQRVTSRRGALRKAGTLGAAALFAGAAPFAFEKALASSRRDAQVHDVLNFALTLEYLESEYYNIGLATPGLIPSGGAREVYEQIAKHENQHVAFLRAVIQSLGETPVEKPEFDFTAGGMFNPFDDYGVFLALSQGFEDTGVRAYKGQAGNLYAPGGGPNPVLTAALQIHSVEARHASEVRRLRGQPGWIEFDQTNVPALEPVYAGEDNTVQAGVDVQTLTTKSTEAITEAFDEPLSMEAVLAIAGPFIKG